MTQRAMIQHEVNGKRLHVDSAQSEESFVIRVSAIRQRVGQGGMRLTFARAPLAPLQSLLRAKRVRGGSVRPGTERV